MKLYLDSANLKDIERYNHLIEGVTTNPTLFKKSNSKFEDAIFKLLDIVKGVIHIEILSANATDIINEVNDLRDYSSKRLIPKIPITYEGLKAISQIHNEIDVNVTLVFSAAQAILAENAGAKYISVFVGRLDDIGINGLKILDEINDVTINSKIIAASIRNSQHVIDAAKMKCDYATIPANILSQMYNHNLTDVGIKKFYDDWHTS
jgi:transaldolase